MPNRGSGAIWVFLTAILLVAFYCSMVSCEGCITGDDDDDEGRGAYERCGGFVQILGELYECYSIVYDVIDISELDNEIYKCDSKAIEQYTHVGGCLGDYSTVQNGIPTSCCIINICGNDFGKCHSDCANSMDIQYDYYSCATEEECVQLLSSWCLGMSNCVAECL